MRKLLISSAIAIGLITCGATSSFADSPAQAAVAAPEIPAAKLALVKRLDHAMNFDAMMKQMFGSLMPAMVDAQRKTHPEITDEQSKVLTSVVIDVMAKYTPRMKDKIFNIYAEVFTEDELTSIVEFYESKNGQSMLQKTHLVMQKFLPTVTDMIPEMQSDMAKALCEKQLCSATDSAAK